MISAIPIGRSNAGGSRRYDILLLDAEHMCNMDGGKQDCEFNAGKRLIERLRQEYRQLPMILMGDDLYAHDPFTLELRVLRMNFELVAKPDFHRELYDRVEDVDGLGQCVKGSAVGQVPLL